MTNTRIPRLAAINDMSGFGRCSLTVAIPALAAMAIEVCPVPTALLSTHTGGFTGFSFNDLTDDMEAFLNHWHSLNLEFECVYTGFLGSDRQIDIVDQFIDTFQSPNCLIAVDPVMGDHGKLYGTYTQSMQDGMGRLVNKADVVMPNYTEACFVLGDKYKEDPLTDQEAKDMLLRLAERGPKQVVMTGLREGNDISVVSYDKDKNKFYKETHALVPTLYHGTGDLYSSVLIGHLVLGKELPYAVAQASAFTLNSVIDAYHSKMPFHLGVPFEKYLSIINDFPLGNITCEEF